MQKSYGVVWREGDLLAHGKLEFLPHALLLEGITDSASESVAVQRRLAYRDLGVTIGRGPRKRINGLPTVVLEPRGEQPITVTTVAGTSLVSEIAERLAEAQVGAIPPPRVVLVVPLKDGSYEAVYELLQAGPPFDPEAIPGLDRHEVFLTSHEAVFVFESGSEAAMRPLLRAPGLWDAAVAWQEHLAGPPRIAAGVYSWARADTGNGLSSRPTPGPGDSDGGDVFAP